MCNARLRSDTRDPAGLGHSQGAALPPLRDPGPCGLLICCVTPPEPSSSSYQGLPLLWVLERGSPARTPHCSAVTSTARPSPSPLQPPQTMQAATGSACPRPTPTQASRHAGKNPSHPKTLGEVLRSQEHQKHEHSFSLESSKSTRSLTTAAPDEHAKCKDWTPADRPKPSTAGFPHQQGISGSSPCSQQLCHRQQPPDTQRWESQPWSPLRQLLGSKATLHTAQFSCVMLQHPRCCPTCAMFPPQPYPSNLAGQYWPRHTEQ